MAYDFVIVDVFTDRPFGGNQLAVFPDARGLSARAMQALAREFNFAESTFVLPAEDSANTARVRIFSPLVEMPFAGHPTVGTAAVLAHLGILGAAGAPSRAVFEERVAPVAVDVSTRDGKIYSQLTIHTGLDEPTETPDRQAISAVLSLSPADLLDCWFAGAGLGFCFAQLADRETVDRAVLDQQAWATHLAQAWSPHLYLFAGELTAPAQAYARMFGPAAGINEDSASGSAVAALAGTLANRSPGADGRCTLEVDQGVLMGRPSHLTATATKAAGRVTSITVGGYTAVVGQGTISLPAGY